MAVSPVLELVPVLVAVRPQALPRILLPAALSRSILAVNAAMLAAQPTVASRGNAAANTGGNNYCGGGCQPAFGTCAGTGPTTTSSATVTSTVISPTPTGNPTTARVYSQCNNPNQIAITFDDGPYQYTQQLISMFNARGAKLTLFVNGLNWACIYNRADLLRSAYNQGHQIGSHTWSHADLVTLSQTQLESEIIRVDTALSKILGAKPTHMRPPYGSYNQNVVNTAGRLGYTSVDIWNFDSGDTTGISADAQFQRYQNARTDIGLIALNHDVKQSTVETLAPRVLDWAQARGLQIVTVGECLGQGRDQWYREVTVQGSPDSTWAC